MTTIVEVNQLYKKFKDFEVVKKIDLAVENGACFGLLGPNGAGKSTTIKMLTTLLSPTSGQAKICGFDVYRQSQYVRESIGYVPQAISVDGTLTAYENLLIMAKLFGLSSKEHKSRISDVIELLELQDAAYRPAKSFSGGMIRKLEIGQAILHRPRVLFLDEPTVGLDPVARKTVWKHIEQLRKQYQMTIMMTTHYMEEAESMCSSIAIMRQGVIAATGTSEQLKNQTGNASASMDEVFAYFAGSHDQQSQGGIKDVHRSRRTAQRLS
jgi:ABC-2 type transport system ATP-binding protein